MKKVITAIVVAVIVALMAFGYMGAAKHSQGETGQQEELNLKSLIFGHLMDSYGWEVPFSHDVRIPLPVIVRDQQGTWHCFSSARVTGGDEYQGFKVAQGGNYDGKLVQVLPDGSQYRPLDLSITKDVAGILIAAIVVLLTVFGIKRWYTRHGLQAPRKGTALLEVIVDFVYTDTVKPILGKEAPKYAPYLLTVFFFILTMNLLGLVVIFPGGANLTGNIAVTMTLALITFAVTNLTGTSHYWKDIFWPDVPVWLKCPVPMMPVIELFGVFTKPFSLMVRLFANMMGGHMVVIVFTLLIFIFGSMFGTAVAVGTTVFSLAFSLFMLLLDTLVSFIQAYVFTILSTTFISMAHVHPAEHEAVAAEAGESELVSSK